MAQAVNGPLHGSKCRDEWVARVNALVNGVEEWACAQDWAVARSGNEIHERSSGEYTVPLLRVRLAEGEIHVFSVGRDVMGAEGRVDIEAFLALSRVRLVYRDRQWQIITDSNVPLRQPWNAETFAQLARDLVA